MNRTKPTETVQAPWPWILCLVGLDFFGMLAYQPSIALSVARDLAPLATALAVAFTLLLVLPIYWQLVAIAPEGRGAVGYLAGKIPGWRTKTVVLVLLGFAATQFVTTKSLAASDAAEHLIGNPAWHDRLAGITAAIARFGAAVESDWLRGFLASLDLQLMVSLVVALVGFAFWAVLRHGFTRLVLRIAAILVAAYLVLTAFVLCVCVADLAREPEPIARWADRITHAATLSGAGALRSIAGVCLWAVPSLAFVLGGFEMSMVVVPLIQARGDSPLERCNDRIRQARKLLTTAALAMSLYLLTSSFATSLLISETDRLPGAAAHNRALAWLAHAHLPQQYPWVSPWLGSTYDLATILVLTLAGASVMVGLKDLVPSFLLQFGMEFRWAHRVGATVLIFNAVVLVIVVWFDASVDALRGALSTSVLVLLAAAAFACRRDLAGPASLEQRLVSLLRRRYFAVGLLLVAGALVLSLLVYPRSLLIAIAFVVAILAVSIVSRSVRSVELRHEGFEFADDESRFLWDTLRYLDFRVLVPHRPGRRSLELKEESVRRWHRLPPETPVVFLEAEMGDPSNFGCRPKMRVVQDQGRVVLRISGCVSVAHVVSAVALELMRNRDMEIHFGWSDDSPMKANLNFVLFGQGNVPWMVREILRHAEPDPAKRPRIIMG
ncbi:MAG: amino acid transporter [Pirellulales bacterium]|nr:amino acid transporter [Pirellulales bacterium]